MGTCMQTARSEGDRHDEIYGIEEDPKLEYPQTTDSNKNTQNTQNNTNNTPNTNAESTDLPSKHAPPFSNNSSSSNDSITVGDDDGPLPPLQQIPSYSTQSDISVTNKKPIIKTHKKPQIPLRPINDDKPTDPYDDDKIIDINFVDIDDERDPEIDDTNHVNVINHDSDEALEAIKSSSGSNDNISDETDIYQDNNNVFTQQINHINNGKEEFESDEEEEDEDETGKDGQQSMDSSEQDSDTEFHTEEEDDEDVEPEPTPEYNINRITVTDAEEEKLSLEELSNITFKCIQSASSTQAGTSKGKSKTNQDSFICFDNFGPSSIFQLYGVCDGHGPNGNDVSKYVTDHLPLILNELLTNSLAKLSIKSILKKSFDIIEENLTKLQNENTLTFDINYSGTTATIGLFVGNKLYVANIGDSRTVLGQCAKQKNKNIPISIALSTDHDPKNSKEMIRIKKSKSGRILQGDDDDDARIQIELPTDAFLSLAAGNSNNNTKSKHRRSQSQVKKISASVSRSIGDRMAHKYGGLISEPEITVHNLSDDDIFVIFASDGIWQMIENDDVMRMVGTKLNQNKNEENYKDLEKTTNKLVREANISWQDEYEDYTDDITCVIARIGKI